MISFGTQTECARKLLICPIITLIFHLALVIAVIIAFIKFDKFFTLDANRFLKKWIESHSASFDGSAFQSLYDCIYHHLATHSHSREEMKSCLRESVIELTKIIKIKETPDKISFAPDNNFGSKFGGNELVVRDREKVALIDICIKYFIFFLKLSYSAKGSQTRYGDNASR